MKSLFLILTIILASNNSLSQTPTAIVGQKNLIKIAIPNVLNTNKCNIDVTLPDQQKMGVEVDGPEFITNVEFFPQQIGNTVILWEGKTKFRGLGTVFACPGSGVVQVQVKGNGELVTELWNQYFSKISDEIKDCMKVGMDLSQIRYQSLSDPNAVLTSPDDIKLKPIYDKCDSFAKLTHPRKATTCTLASLNNLKTICDGVYAEKQPDGRLRAISRANAIELHFEGKPWTTGVIENTDARTTRLKQEDEDKSKQAATIAAQKEAEEKERKFRSSPEYKMQQAELERKRIADEKAEAIRIKKEQEERARVEKENLQREKLAAEARRAEAEARRAEAEKTRIDFAKKYPYYAVINCGGGFPLHACFSCRVKTDLEINDGESYKMYSIYDMMQLPYNSGEGTTINLRSKFDIKMQNCDSSLYLNLKIYNRSTQKIVFEKSASQYGVIRVSN